MGKILTIHIISIEQDKRHRAQSQGFLLRNRKSANELGIVSFNADIVTQLRVKSCEKRSDLYVSVWVETDLQQVLR